MSSPAQDLLDAIDRIDGSTFGELGKLFDRMAVDARRAVNERDDLLKALEDAKAAFSRIIASRDNKNWRKPELIAEAERGFKSCSL